MKQALHIFRKDLHYLAREIALFIALVALFVWTELHLAAMAYAAEGLLLIAFAHLIARVIHAEPLADDRQFWLTRPYRWQSLLLAKFVFIAVVLIVPMSAGRILVVQQESYPVLQSLPAIAWWSLLMLAAAALPIAALAVLTSGSIQFSVTVLGMALSAALLFVVGPYILNSNYHLHAPIWPAGMIWIQSSFVLFAVVGCAAWLLWRQYRTRATESGRRIALGLALSSGFVYFAVPVSAGLALESLLYPAPAHAPSAEVTKSSRGFAHSGDSSSDWGVPVTLAIARLSDGQDIQADLLNTTFQWPGEPAFHATANPGATAGHDGTALVSALVKMDAGTFERNKTKPLTLQGAIHLTLLGESKESTISADQKKVNIQDGLQCSPGAFNAYDCRSYFGWPARLVLSRDASGESSFMRVISYSPIPAALGLDTQESHHTTLEPGAKTVTVITRRPIAHVRISFKRDNFRLIDLIEQPPPPPGVHKR